MPLVSPCAAAESIVGDSAAARGLRSLIMVAAPTRLAVLIQGPTGAGKELVAAALHAASGRRGHFVPFNVCAIGDSMFEDALFGHVRGAYTGALSDAPGFLLEADGGTAFFDEVSGLQPVLQAKLLRAIETGEFRPIGGRRDTRSDSRVVTATNERLDVLIAERPFRADLAHRIGGVIINVPPLAERLEDIPMLKSAGAAVYLDAGHARWQPADTMAARLADAGVASADGFALNVSNFVATDVTIAYGDTISRLTGDKHFIIDTSRNGAGGTTDAQWCNPAGQALGDPPTTHTGHALVDAFLWIKVPGESDGTCNGGPSAGTWWPDYALGLAQQQLARRAEVAHALTSGSLIERAIAFALELYHRPN